VLQYVALGVMMLLGGTTLVGLLMSSQPEVDPNVLAHALAGAGIAIMAGTTLFFLIMMAMQYAPVLVFINGLPPIGAMKLSLKAFFYNVGPMLVYGVTFVLLAILASIPMMLGWLVLLPIVFTSLYESYCDIFPQEGNIIEGEVTATTIDGA
jgi:uncharacterized membrane protein